MSTDTNDGTFPAEPTRPARDALRSQIDQLVVNTLPTSMRYNNDGTTEQLPTPHTESANSHNANVAEPPSIDSLGDQMRAHQAHIESIDSKLAAQVFNRLTGQPEGPRVTGADRERLIAERTQRHNEIMYTIKLMQDTSEARIAWNKARAAQAASGNADPHTNAMADAARREAAISELADMPGEGGKPVGRVAAAREYDAAQLRARAEKLARGR